MPAITFGGLTSGLDTRAIVDQLMAVERNPQVLLQNKLAKQNQTVSALQGINTRLASLATSAAEFAKPETWTRATATASDKSVSVVAGPTAGTGSISFRVNQLADRGSWTTQAFTADQFGPQKIVVTSASGEPRTVTATGGSAQELAAAINAAGGNVRATTVRTGDGQYRLLMTSLNTGAADDITKVEITNADGSASAMTKPVQLARGQDAKVDLGFGNLVSSPTNTFTGLMTGTDVTLTEKVTGLVTVSSQPDLATVAKAASGVVGALNVALSEMAEQSRADVTKPGVLSGSSLVRGIQQQLAATMSSAVPGATLADLGVQLQRDGSVKIDEAAFTTFATAHPDEARALTAVFGTAVADAAKQASAAGTGSISQSITSATSTARDLGERIADLDTRLDLRRATLERQFTALDVAISASKNTQGWLAGQIAGLPGYGR